MTKTLSSGIKVDDQEYYKLLDWKDSNEDKFEIFCDQQHIMYSTSINGMSLILYTHLLIFSKTH